MSTFHVDIVSAEGQIFAGDATAVSAPAIAGDIGLLPRHAPLLTRLKPGVVRVQTAAGEQSIFVGGGILEVQPTLVTVLADSALRAEQADEAAAIAARQRAEEKLSNAKHEVDLAKAQAELIEANARLRFIQELSKISS